MKPSEAGAQPASQSEFTKIQELMYELRIDQIMTRSVITIAPGASMSDAKEMMRFHRFSGLPVMGDVDLIGLVSVEDVIRWLEQGAPHATVKDWMTERVFTVRCDETAIMAITRFSRHKVGRLPVLDSQGKLAGIVTPGDIMGRILRVLDARYREQEARRPRARITLEDLVSDDAVLKLHYRVAPNDFQKAGTGATRIKRILECFGVDPQVVRRVGIAAYEAEMNLTIHTERGGRLTAEIRPDRVELEASDNGPGIDDLESALTPGFSTAPDWIRELGFGAGMGLCNMKMCADDFRIESEIGKGTVVRVSVAVRPGKEG